MTSFHAALQASLSCPKCGASNRPGATIIELSDDRLVACCAVCARYGPITNFLPKEMK
jgi:hypothetical protein